MKKVFLCIAIAVCSAICGTALAVTYFNATPLPGSVGADKYVILDLDGSSDTTDIALATGGSSIYKIACGVTKSPNATASGTLTVKLTPTTDKNLTGVTVTLYTSSMCTPGTEVTDGVLTGGTAEVSKQITGISQSIDYYAKVTYTAAQGLTPAQLANVAGTMSVQFVQPV